MKERHKKGSNTGYLDKERMKKKKKKKSGWKEERKKCWRTEEK